jgi:hypothetical protein
VESEYQATSLLSFSDAYPDCKLVSSVLGASIDENTTRSVQPVTFVVKIKFGMGANKTDLSLPVPESKQLANSYAVYVCNNSCVKCVHPSNAHTAAMICELDYYSQLHRDGKGTHSLY